MKKKQKFSFCFFVLISIATIFFMPANSKAEQCPVRVEEELKSGIVINKVTEKYLDKEGNVYKIVTKEPNPESIRLHYEYKRELLFLEREKLLTVQSSGRDLKSSVGTTMLFKALNYYWRSP